jgi:hypothetical protein
VYFLADRKRHRRSRKNIIHYHFALSCQQIFAGAHGANGGKKRVDLCHEKDRVKPTAGSIA